MTILTSLPQLRGFRFPRETIAYTMWAYQRFVLCTADVEDLLAEHGVIVNREADRLWVNRFGSQFAACIQRDRRGPHDKWHMDEVVVPINGVRHWLWRVIDGNGNVLDILIQPRRNANAAKSFFVRLVAAYGELRTVITDKLRKFTKPIKAIVPGVDHRAHKGLDNRIEGSRRKMRKQEKMMGRLKSPRQAQRFLVAHDQISTIFNPRGYRLSTLFYRHARADAFKLWKGYAAELSA